MNPHHRSEARQVGVADATAAMIHAIQFGGAMESPGRKGSVEDVGEPFKNMFFFKWNLWFTTWNLCFFLSL